MTTFVDTSYYGFNRGYYPDNPNPYRFLEELVDSNTILVYDSEWSWRKNSLDWYKANRREPDLEQRLLRQRANAILDGIRERWPQNCISEPGLEADDVIAQMVQPGDIVFCNDKDYLTVPVEFFPMQLNYQSFDCERFRAPHLPLRRGNRALAYQLLYGDVADNIPRLWWGDKAVAAYVFECPNPLEAAVQLLAPADVRRSLAALALPTPLRHWDRCNLIDCVLEAHPA